MLLFRSSSRRQARRFRSRLVLCLLLGLACSPSVVTLLLLSSSGQQLTGGGGGGGGNSGSGGGSQEFVAIHGAQEQLRRINVVSNSGDNNNNNNNNLDNNNLVMMRPPPPPQDQEIIIPVHHAASDDDEAASAATAALHEQQQQPSQPQPQPQQSLQDCAAAAATSSTTTTTTCCAEWTTNENTDEWWTHHPDWWVGHENATHTCFRRMTDPAQVQFVQSLHQLQYYGISSSSSSSGENGDFCAKAWQSTQISSGYAAALMAVARSFYASYQAATPFQITLAHDEANWNFAPRNASQQSSWAYCPTRDMNCYFLPLSPCPAVTGQNDAPRGIKPSTAQAKREFAWLRQYAFRPRHAVRWQLQQQYGTVLDELLLTPTTTASTTTASSSNEKAAAAPCTAIHVRRGDIAFGKGRRYAAVDEYLQAGNVQPGETVVLLTDDVSAVQEVERYLLQDYHWVYLQRPRFRGAVGGFEGFIPSQDPAAEVLAILAELQLASQCRQLVHGKSGFVAVILEAMELAHSQGGGGPDSDVVKAVYLQTQQDKKQQAKMDPADRAAIYWQQIEEYYQKRKQQQQQPQMTTSR